MGSPAPAHHMLAFGIAALAGMVDALGLLKLGGLFVSFMSGNSTRMAVGIATDPALASAAAGLIGAFVAGVFVGALTARAAGRWRKPAILSLVLLLLICAALLAGSTGSGLTMVMAGAMGVVNNVFQRDGEVSIGVTYMTGALVKLGQGLAAAVTGGARLGWIAHLLLWLGLVAGAVVGAMLFGRMGLDALWIACLWCGLLVALSIGLGPLPVHDRLA